MCAAASVPASSFRDLVVPPPPAEQATPDRCHHLDRTQAAAEPIAKPSKRRTRYSWAGLMKRVWKLDVLVCPHCSGTRRVLEFLTNPTAIERILTHFGLPTAAPAVAEARPRPAGRLYFHV